jgi:uncharacterized protein (TIGR00369 family)
MATFEVPDPDFASRVAASFGRQAFMGLIGAVLETVEPGRVSIRLPHRADLTQQHGFFHGGVVGTISDSACGYAAFTLAPADHSILTVEYKLNLVAPGQGGALVARAEVVRPGRTLVVTRADVYAERAGAEKLVATALSTMMLLAGRSDAQAA